MRTRARNGWERSVQVLRWLKDEFDLPEGLRLELVPHIEGHDVLGQVIERNGEPVIQLSKKMLRTVSEMVDTVIHEAAHVKLWHASLGNLHGPQFWRVFGAMMDAFDHHGHSDSKTYPVD